MNCESGHDPHILGGEQAEFASRGDSSSACGQRTLSPPTAAQRLVLEETLNPDETLLAIQVVRACRVVRQATIGPERISEWDKSVLHQATELLESLAELGRLTAKTAQSQTTSPARTRAASRKSGKKTASR